MFPDLIPPDGYLRRTQRWGAGMIGLFLVSQAWKGPLVGYSAAVTTTSLFWCYASTMIALVAAASFVRQRQSGRLGAVLATPLDAGAIVDGMTIRILETLWPTLIAILVWGAVLFWGFPSSLRYVATCEMLTWFLYATVTIYFGMACSLAAKRPRVPVSLTLGFNFGTGFLLAFFLFVLPGITPQRGFDLLLSVLIASSLLTCRRAVTLPMVVLRFVTVYLGLAWLGNSWNYTIDGAYPLSACFPLFWIEKLPASDIYGVMWGYKGRGAWWQSLACYWIAMVGTILWARWWLIRNLRNLAGMAVCHEPKHSLSASSSISPKVVGNEAGTE